MSMIRVATYKASIQADGSIYNESVEMSSEIDSMPLSPDQLAVAMDRVTEMRAAILARRKAWEGATVPDAPKEQPKPAGQATIDGSKALDMTAYDRNRPGWTKCPKCGQTGITHEQKPPKKGTWQGCYDCGLFLNADGTMAQMKPKGA